MPKYTTFIIKNGLRKQDSMSKSQITFEKCWDKKPHILAEVKIWVYKFDSDECDRFCTGQTGKQ